MARSTASVWGIEVGQTAIKALRCSLVGGEVVADAFDFIEYPKILSQPEADAEELIKDALSQLLERNDAINEKVCISVPGQSGLAKFFKPPPVEVKKIADIVRYEARQQIPFDLADVVWDFQIMPGSMVEEGYALESEVGLFAMKREMAYRQLAPFDDANIEVDEVQLAPIALFNMLTYDRMNERVDNDVFDADNPPPSTVLLSIGTDSSDLLITNGFRIWQRSMPIGGNHFTRQLTKDLKLTFAKAEHLKRNAREAVDPKLIFQTMRPVFNDLVTEVQRSIGFFRSIDKKAEIEELLITGNTVKMPGLAAYLGKNLGIEVQVIDRFNRLGGEDVHAIPTFRDNAPTFAVCYGLCLQGLGISQIHASLVPKEILTQRMIRAKKPWTLAALAALLIGMTLHYGLSQKSWATTRDDLWGPAKSAVDQTSSYSNEQKTTDGVLDAQLTYLNEMGKAVSGNATRYREEIRNWRDLRGNRLTPEEEEELLALEGPSGPGWVIQLICYHYYNDLDRIGYEGSDHVRRLMMTAFMESTVELPVGNDENGNPILEEFTLKQMGLDFPMLLNEEKASEVSIPNPDFDEEAAMTAKFSPTAGSVPGGAYVNENGDVIEPATLLARKYEFAFQMVWQENTPSERLAAKIEEERLKAEEEAAAGGTEVDDLDL